MSTVQPYPEQGIDPGMAANIPQGPVVVPPGNVGRIPDENAVPPAGKFELPSWQQANSPQDYYRDNGFQVEAPVTSDPDTLIRNKIADAKLESQANKQRFQQSVTVPMLMQDIERSHLLEQESITAITRAQGQLSAQAPQMPTDTRLNVGEVGAGIVSMFAGGDRGKSANVLAGIAQRRQQLAFENAMRQFSLDKENAARNYEQAINDRNFYRGLGVDQGKDLREEARFQQGLDIHNQERLEDRVDRWEGMGLSRDIARETAQQEHDWDLAKFDLQKKANAELAQLSLEIDFKKMAKSDIYDRATKAREHLYGAQTPEEAQMAVEDLGRLGIKVPAKIQKWATDLGRKNWALLNASLAVKAAAVDARANRGLTPSEIMSQAKFKEDYSYDPLAGQIGSGGGGGGLSGQLPLPSGGSDLPVGPVQIKPGSIIPGTGPGMVSPNQLPTLDQATAIWDSVGSTKTPRGTAYTKLKGLIDQKSFLDRSDTKPKGPDIASNPEWAEYRKKKRDTDLQIVGARNELEQKLTSPMRQQRDVIAEFALRQINNIGNDKTLSKEEKKAQQDEIRRSFSDKFLVDLDYKGLKMNQKRKAPAKKAEQVGPPAPNVQGTWQTTPGGYVPSSLKK